MLTRSFILFIMAFRFFWYIESIMSLNFCCILIKVRCQNKSELTLYLLVFAFILRIEQSRIWSVAFIFHLIFFLIMNNIIWNIVFLKTNFPNIANRVIIYYWLSLWWVFMLTQLIFICLTSWWILATMFWILWRVPLLC